MRRATAWWAVRVAVSDRLLGTCQPWAQISSGVRRTGEEEDGVLEPASVSWPDSKGLRADLLLALPALGAEGHMWEGVSGVMGRPDRHAIPGITWHGSGQ